jgi:hypothetical protein
MSNNKQSSVELFAIALYEAGYWEGNVDKLNDLLDYHKAMHKEEIQDAWNDGYNEIGGPEQYYNETYGGNK